MTTPSCPPPDTPPTDFSQNRMDFLRRILPRVVKRRLRELHRRWTFVKAMRSAVRAISRDSPVRQDTLEQLVYGWGNPQWSALPEYLGACLDEVKQSKGLVVECGSGLSTLLLGAVAKNRGLPYVALEHQERWAARVRREARRWGLSNVQVEVAPLQSFEEFDWYGFDPDRLTEDVAVLICDGPPGKTRGGRAGAVAVLRSRLAPGCVIMVDDAKRPAEARIANQWASELGSTIEKRGTEKPYFVLRCDAARG